MQIMSDAEAFGWKITSITFGLILFVIIIHGMKHSEIEDIPNIVYDTITVTDTITVHDTITKYYPQKDISNESNTEANSNNEIIL